jgi:hypothetical protein
MGRCVGDEGSECGVEASEGVLCGVKASDGR